MKEGNGFEGWKEEKMEGRCWPPLPMTDRLNGKKQGFFDFGERKKRKWFGYFVVEVRVDEWYYCMLKMAGKRNIYRGR